MKSAYPKLTTQLFFLTTIMLSLSMSISAQSVRVETQRLTTRNFQELLKLQGNVESARVARVSTRITGPIDEIFVNEGDSVKAGKTALFKIDSVKLQKNVEIRRQELAIARLSLKEKQARLRQARADFSKAQSDLNRFRLLWEENSTSADNYEKVLLKHQLSQTTVEHAQVLVELAGEQLKQAELALTIAEKDFSDSTVFAPINGKIVARLQEDGETALPGKPIVIIKDTASTEICAHIPGFYFHRIIKDQTMAKITAENSLTFKRSVSFKSPVINPAIRTFQIKFINNDASIPLIPGSLVEISLILSEQTGFAVDNNAILNRTSGKIIFVVRDGLARMVSVETSIENDGQTLIKSEKLAEGDLVVISGQNLLRHEQPVNISGGQ